MVVFIQNFLKPDLRHPRSGSLAPFVLSAVISGGGYRAAVLNLLRKIIRHPPCCPGHDGHNGAERDRQGGKGLPPFSCPNQGIFSDQIGEITRCCGKRRAGNAVIFSGGQTALRPSRSMRKNRFALAFINDGSDPVGQMSIYERSKALPSLTPVQFRQIRRRTTNCPCKIGIIS
jgi:hypothetical protein